VDHITGHHDTQQHAQAQKRGANMDNPMTEQTLVENIDQYLEDGMPVYDVNSDRVGAVKMYSATAGYLMVGSGAFGHENLYIPFRLITSIDPRDIFLSETKDVLAAQYTQPPKISTITEERLVTEPDGALVPKKRDVQLVTSGYDSLPVTINSVDAKKIGKRLAVGMAVYDADTIRVGDITQYDTTRNLMTVEKGIFKPRVLIVPFSAVERVEPDTFTVYLNLPRDVVVKEHTMFFADAK
jgi:hypothetical protein